MVIIDFTIFTCYNFYQLQKAKGPGRMFWPLFALLRAKFTFFADVW
ncbi:hypothetical protein CLOSTHATH_03247 [Hungatella hathewayi DSM 13479]|uniref:Uncharacterized protein n=1 Tax=Hungatella hathewayi DSM 13479 TaxID=566550 RepID=D3AI08_9FIRM|nr:hypothetical protein CLOSTHATH_03247 [Hungatella hathewayi DSM 13479]